MSLKIQRSELVEIARSVYSGHLEIEAHLKSTLKKKPIGGIFNKIEENLWRKLVQEHPLKDFSGEQESRTRRNIFKKICVVIKSKCFSNFLHHETSNCLR